ncbi:hypothetical protein U1Q18_047412, partial [Sarracenia purpurea var. burkii]
MNPLLGADSEGTQINNNNSVPAAGTTMTRPPKTSSSTRLTLLHLFCAAAIFSLIVFAIQCSLFT